MVLKYVSGYKYQLENDQIFPTDITPPELIDDEYISLTPEGLLTIKKGYAWDGASGGAYDTRTFMFGSLVHDALYQLICDKKIDIKWRKPADKILYNVLLKAGMWKIRALWVYYAVRIFGGSYLNPKVATEVFNG